MKSANGVLAIRMEHSDPVHAKTVVVNWCLGNTCNYSCSYCPSGLHNGSLPWAELAAVRGFTTRLAEHYQGRLGRKLYVEFTGGEPTLYRDFIPLLEHLKVIGAYAGLISNGSLSLRFWEKCAGLLDHVCLSFHPEFGDPEKFLKVVDFMHRRVSTHVNVMMHPKHFDMCLAVAESAAGTLENASLSLQPVLETLLPGSSLQDYSAEQARILSEKSFRIPWTKAPFTYRGGMRMHYGDGSNSNLEAPQFIVQGINRWKGWSCWAGVDELAIYADGNVYRGWCKQDLIGTILDADISFPDNPTVCLRDSCHCNLDIMNRREAP